MTKADIFLYSHTITTPKFSKKRRHSLLSLLHFIKSKPLVGLDIHADEVRLLQLKRVKNSIKVEKQAVCELPAGVIVDGKIKQMSSVITAIQELVRETQTQGCPAAIALPSQCVISQRIRLASILQDVECEIEISTRLSHYLPGVNDSLCFDFAIQGQLDAEHNDVLLIAARDEQVNSYVDVVNHSGLIVKIVEVDSHALMRAAKFFIPRAFFQQTIAVLDIGQTVALLVVYQDGHIVLNQQFSILKNNMQLESQLKKILKLYFFDDQKIALNFFLAGCDDILLTAVADYLRKEFSTAVDILDPSQVWPFKKAASRMMVSFGLALRGLPVCKI